MPSRRAALVFGAADVLTALAIVVGVFVGLPARWSAVGALDLSGHGRPVGPGAQPRRA